MPSIKVGMLLAFMCFITFSAGTLASLEDRLAKMETIFYQLEEKNIQLEKKVTELETQLKQNNEDREELKSKVQQQETILSALWKEKKEPFIDLNHLINTHQSQVAINGLPSSCADLKMIGHTLNGFYSVMGNTAMESVYCDFFKLPSDAGFQKWIGYADVKSVPVHFYVTRNSGFNTKATPIPFDLAVVNDGNAMDLPSGIFTAPRPGTYFFSFSGLAQFPASSSWVGLEVDLYLNGGRIGAGLVEEGNTVAGQLCPLSLQLALNLKSGDQVWVQIHPQSLSEAYLWDDLRHMTHFTGFMLEEEITASL